MTTVLYLVTLFFGLLLPDVGVVLELTGAVSGSFLAYILPSAMYMCYKREELVGILRQLGLSDSFFCACCVKVTDISRLDNKETRFERSKSEDEDAPIEIAHCDMGSGGKWANFTSTVKALEPFWVSFMMFAFGIVAFLVGTMTTLISMFSRGEEE